MLRSQLLAAAAFGAAMAAGTALPAQAQTGSSAIDEMRREQTTPRTPWVPAQDRAAGRADAQGQQDARQWLTEAEAAIRRGRLGQASELLERAETRLLSRSTPATMADRPMQDPVIDNINAARQAVMRRDRNAAMQSVEAAQSALASWRGDMATGTGATVMPSEGGGPRGMAPGGSTGFAPPAPAPQAPAATAPPEVLRGPPAMGSGSR